MADLPSANPPAATQSIHRNYLEQASPAWLINATPSRRAQFKGTPAALPDWFERAAPSQRQALYQKLTASFTAQTALDKAMAPLQDIDAFAAPLLVKALQEQFNVQLDVHQTLLHLRKPIEFGVLGTTIGSFEVLRLPLLQAALHNFEATECETGAFHASSGFLQQTAAGDIEPLTTALTVTQFTGLCRSLDIGAQYQRHLNDFLYPKDGLAEQALRLKFSAARKADLAAAAETALLKKDITPADYQMIAAVTNGELHPTMGKKQVWFNDLGLMKKRLTGCVAFVICEKYRYADEVILYIPHDPHHPLKRYNRVEMVAMFKQRFTARDTPDPGDGSPTAYQRFFSQFVAYGDLPAYFDALTEDVEALTVGEKLLPYVSLLNELSKGINPFATFTSVREWPPAPPSAKRPNPQPFLNPITLSRKGHGVWADNIELWGYLFEQHRAKTLADARSHAVPTADVDTRVRSQKLAKLLNIGLLALNAVSMFVPVLGEVMMAVMAGQVLYETFAGTLEWSEGDRRAAKAHLVDVAENLAFIAVMAVGGKVVSKVIAAKPEPLIENLDPVALADGKASLWKPDFTGYESPVDLSPDRAPNALGEYALNGKSYIRQSGRLYEKTFDSTLNRWRLQHPTDPQAYQPLLSHNGAGAWRLALERPLEWDRITLLRRLGSMADGFTDEQLLTIADISGTRDDALRKMHVDNAPPPPELADALRLFRADQDVAQVIEQVSSGQAVDGRYLFTLPLVTAMPRWPVGRVLEVFDGPGLTGNSQRYGVERLFHGARLKPAIRISRADVVGSKLPAQILAALDETEVVGLLGGEAARVRDNRPMEFRQQLADYARTRQPALFDSLYRGTEAPDPSVAKLQRLYPGLSEPAAHSVLADTDVAQLRRLHSTGRVPLGMQEQISWHLRRGRLGHAYAGLHMENLTAASSKRLALRTLSTLPGWSDQVRLEVRDGDVKGAVLDSIGSLDAPQRKYLVKRGPVYQAFNERGEALNSLPRHGDNFYASLMHALPDEARQALGMPHVGQSQDLRRAIIDHAVAHPVESAQIVEGAVAQQSWFKPPQRIAPKVLGYPASGRGEGVESVVANRAQLLYALMSEEEALAFVRSERQAGRSYPEIFTLLQNRRDEWNALNTALDNWAGAAPADPFEQNIPGIDPRRRMASALKQCWQLRPLTERPGRANLVLHGDVALPPLSADFSHVRTLMLKGRRLIEGAVLGHFPELQALTLVGTRTSLSNVMGAIEGMSGLTRLHIEGVEGLSSVEQTRLEGLVQLQELTLNSTQRLSRPLDLGRLRRLQALKLSGSVQQVFPTGVLDLPELHRLDFKDSEIDELPAQLFEPGHERLWSGLSLKWSRFMRERFNAAYTYLKSHPEHLMDQDEMVRDYCAGQLYGHLGRPALSNPVNDAALRSAFFARWPTTQERFVAMEALSTEYASLTASLEHWVRQSPQPVERAHRATVDYTLRSHWYQGLFFRHGLSQTSPLNLPGMVVSELPVLAAEGFSHVTELRVPNAQVPNAALSTFMRGFTALHSLDASGCGLTALTVAPGDWAFLKHLDLSNNPLAALDVSGLRQLQALNLHGSALPTWPAGAEQLPELEWLDLRNTRLTQLPAAVLAHDRILLDTNLSGTSLTAEAQSALAAARRRIEQRWGLSDGTLSRFEQRPVDDVFPPEESASSLTQQLLPLLATDAGQVTLPLAQQLQRLHPALGAEGAGQWLERLRGEGLSDPQVGERIATWEQTHGALTRRLNDWIFTRRFSLGHDMLVTSNTRQLAAEDILARWLDGVSGVLANRALSFHGMILGDLPDLALTLDHIDSLNLNGVQLSGQGSNGFLRAFPRLNTLVLSSNPLHTFPDAVVGMAELRRLELSAVGVNDPELLYATLVHLERLQWLDLSYCDLDNFRVDQFSQLHTLNLSNNELTEWPQGALQAGALRALELGSNQLESIPPGALEGAHDRLMAGVNLTDNFGLPLADLQRLQAYAERTGRDRALGLSAADIQQLVNDLEHPQNSDSGNESESNDWGAAPQPFVPDEALGAPQVTAGDLQPWIEHLPNGERAHNTQLWNSLAEEPDNAAFFNLLSLARQTRDYQSFRASLTHRMWGVMEAAASNAELREELFEIAKTQNTCADGRALGFSQMETRVYVFNALNGVNPTDLTLKGKALLDLSRSLFRLEQVELLAGGKPGDPAEVRLKYLIGLEGELKLPGVPKSMIYDRPITGEPMKKAAKEIKDKEKLPAFHQNLILRDFWVGYLQERYPEAFAALAERNEERRTTFGLEHPDHHAEDYAAAAQELAAQIQADDTNTRVALSQQAEAALTAAVRDPNQPGTSAELLGG
ncbi:hypothetical protein NUV89_15780 [Pseudomonas sp. 18.1.10]|uniref:NEL-type E3 ubiquitin ligase domain-containing protein n=1 Tax=Pseudomonas sp. 18.1.10 TaxID=2969302 RepID=UPI00214F9B04|nr:NEL-type E3 ubiquitin ligase domain-containing protein [Pseudomonas sp. 18.1.10]MCR4539859.1 hypothetical protein [Pseudomonas sp. 18.1.10]